MSRHGCHHLTRLQVPELDAVVHRTTPQGFLPIGHVIVMRTSCDIYARKSCNYLVSHDHAVKSYDLHMFHVIGHKNIM